MCLYIFIFLSAIHIVYSNGEPRLHISTWKNWCNTREGAVKVLYGHVCYTLHVGFLTWSAAARDCRAKGGQLFKVDSEELAAAILEKTGPFTAWTGAIERDGQFYWLDGSPVFGDFWSVSLNLITEITIWFKPEKLCMLIALTWDGFVWQKELCSKELVYVCEHEKRRTPTASEIWTSPNTHNAEPDVHRLPGPQNVRSERLQISRVTMRSFMINEQHLFEKRTFAATMCSRLCVFPCQVFNYNTKTGQCRGFASARINPKGEEKSAWDVWEIITL